MEGAPGKQSLRERAMTMVMSNSLEATQPPGMLMMGTSTDPWLAGALKRETTILVGPTKAAEPQSIRDRESRPPYLVVPETEDGHGAAETKPIVVGTSRW